MVHKIVCAIAGAAIFATPALSQANQDFPTSREEAKAEWTKMNPNSFPLTVEQLRSQCDMIAKLHADDWFAPEKCAQLEALFLANEYTEGMMPDGIVLDYLAGLKQGKPFVYEGYQKKLGRLNRVLKFDLGNGIFVYWFVGDINDGSCHNLAVVYDKQYVPLDDGEDPENPGAPTPDQPIKETELYCPPEHQQWSAWITPDPHSEYRVESGLPDRHSFSPAVGWIQSCANKSHWVGGVHVEWHGTPSTTSKSRFKCIAVTKGGSHENAN